MIDWKTIDYDVNPLGSFTWSIKWILPKTSGFIVQRVEIDDPMNLLEGSYDRPYYEAWIVVDGVVIHEDEGPEYYDDSFSNCGDGFFMNIVAENNAKKIKTVGVQKTYVSYNCRVFWVESGTVAYRTVEQWKPADQIGIKMAGKLRASYDAAFELDEGKERKFTAEFCVAEELNQLNNHMPDED